MQISVGRTKCGKSFVVADIIVKSFNLSCLDNILYMIKETAEFCGI